MKLSDLVLLESITFGISQIEKHPEYGDVHSPVGKDVEKSCEYCDATGKEKWDDEEYDCGFCRGEGKYVDFVSDGPELNVANRNGRVLLQLLGEEPEDAGTIFNNELPDLRRRIIRLMNSDDIENATIEPSQSGGELKRKVRSTGDDGVTRITPVRTSKMYGGGLSESQIKRYLREILDMVKIAQKEGYNISWS